VAQRDEVDAGAAVLGAYPAVDDDVGGVAEQPRPRVIRKTEATASTTTAPAAYRDGVIRAIRRRAEGPKVIAFCPTWPPPIGPRCWTIRSVACIRP